jgi:hypothetical protein
MPEKYIFFCGRERKDDLTIEALRTQRKDR